MMKTRTKIFVTILVILMLMGLGIVYFIQKTETSLSELESLQIEDVDLALIEDGVYEGAYSVFPVSVEVKVTVLNHAITDIELIKHINGQGTQAEVIIEDVLLEQSLEVYLVTDATYSSKVILLAIKDALDS
jgi:uncharacterized protein with FMN-binding domain